MVLGVLMEWVLGLGLPPRVAIFMGSQAIEFVGICCRLLWARAAWSKSVKTSSLEMSSCNTLANLLQMFALALISFLRSIAELLSSKDWSFTYRSLVSRILL